MRNVKGRGWRIGLYVAEGGRSVGLETVAVDDDSLRLHLKCVKCTMHSQYRGVQNVYLVYLFRSHDAYSPRYGITLDNLTKFVTTFFR